VLAVAVVWGAAAAATGLASELAGEAIAALGWVVVREAHDQAMIEQHGTTSNITFRAARTRFMVAPLGQNCPELRQRSLLVRADVSSDFLRRLLQLAAGTR
jgi:hypothetical protein